jgi:quercetin dioxygenase-like cupin family protein
MKLGMLAAALCCALAFAAQSLAAGPPIVAKALALGKMQATTIHAQTGSMVLETFEIKPGGSFGWHTHGASVAVIVAAGTLTVFDPTVGNCAPFKVSKGQSFVEPANHVHLARNDTAKPVKVYAMYLGIPASVAPNKPAAQPAACTP